MLKEIKILDTWSEIMGKPVVVFPLVPWFIAIKINEFQLSMKIRTGCIRLVDIHFNT